MRLLPVLLLGAALACAGGPHPRFAPPPAGTDDAAAREVLGRFTRALEAGRFDEAHALLSARWRAAYTPGRLALDYRGGPGSRDAALRALRALAAGAPVVRGPEGARLGAGRGPLLVVEAGGWRVDSLE